MHPPIGHVITSTYWVGRGTTRGSEGVRRTHLSASTMLQSACRSVFHLLAGSKPPRNLTRLNGRSPCERRSLVNSPLIPFAPASPLLVRRFTSTSRISARHLRSGDRKKAAYVGTTGDDSPRKVDPSLPFQAPSLRDAFVTTVVSVGISESCKHRCVGLERS